ncbi:MAG: flagellar hook-basal body complex protein, partial [Sulfurimonas sp.]
QDYSPAYKVPAGAALNPPALDANGNPIASDDMGVVVNEVGEALNLQKNQGVWVSFASTKVVGAALTAAEIDGDLDLTFELDNGDTVNITSTGSGDTTIAQTAARFVSAINAKSSVTGITATFDSATNQLSLVNQNNVASASHNIRMTVGGADDSGFVDGDTITSYRYQYDPTGSNKAAGTDKTFTTMADLREALQNQADALSAGVEISVNEQGKIKVDNSSGANDITIAVTSIVPESIAGGGVSANSRFTRAMEALSATLPSGSPGTAFSQSFNAAIHSASIDIVDSLGTKHTLRMEFRKVDVDAFTGSTWSFKLSVPEPATIDTVVPFNEKTGTVRFNNDGSLASFDPPNISFTANNGSAPDQQVAIGLGTANGFDGMTSFDAKSSTSGISQDGFTGGDLVGIRIDQSGTLIGSFSNGRSFGLAQVGMAKFTNNEGLSAEGSNVYVQSANSGDPIIGTAASAGRGFIQSAALEASNVDLSSALTQLIIIQRGYQANGKTITTSDTLLETLLGIKR